MATYWITYEVPATGNIDILSLCAADAKSMKKADCLAARRNAVKRAQAKLQTRHGKVLITDCRCVG